MAQSKYQIFQLSARAVMSYAVETGNGYSFDLSASATEKCKSRTATHEQDSNSLFFQIMCVLRGDGYAEPSDGKLISNLSDAIFYMDFARVFDRSAANKKQRVRQEKARAMFRPEGVGLDFGSGLHRYVAFERSGSMSRQARLSFIRADLYDAVRRRVMLGMDIDRCQLSKLYAYNGLMLSSGTRIDGVDIDRPTGSSWWTTEPAQSISSPSSPWRTTAQKTPPGNTAGWRKRRKWRSPALTARG